MLACKYALPVTAHELARLGGYARAKSLPKARRIAIARYAALCRWAKQTPPKKRR